MSYRISGLDPRPFAPLFNLDAEALAAVGARRVRVDQARGYPCRVSLDEVPLGDEALLIHYEHQPAPTPFRASHAIYVGRSARERYDGVDAVPPALASRLLSIRAFDAGHMMIDAEVAPGAEAGQVFDALLAQPVVAYLHAHYARFGCYAARVDRASSNAVQPESGANRSP
jgi:hypothetical protein